MNFRKMLIMTILSLSTLFSAEILAANHTVTAKATSFKPVVIKADIGDTVSWEKMKGHTTQSILEFIPKGGDSWISPMSKNFTTPEFSVEGIYFYKCLPHWGVNMGGVIIVGNPTNLSDIESSKPKGAAKRLLKKTRKALKN